MRERASVADALGHASQTAVGKSVVGRALRRDRSPRLSSDSRWRSDLARGQIGGGYGSSGSTPRRCRNRRRREQERDDLARAARSGVAGTCNDEHGYNTLSFGAGAANRVQPAAERSSPLPATSGWNSLAASRSRVRRAWLSSHDLPIESRAPTERRPRYSAPVRRARRTRRTRVDAPGPISVTGPGRPSGRLPATRDVGANRGGIATDLLRGGHGSAVTRVCLVGSPDVDLRYELLSRETAREALSTHDLRRPFENSVAVDTISLGAAVSLLNDLNWYLTRFADLAFVLEPSVSSDEWLSRDLATRIRDGDADPAETGDLLAVYGIVEGRLVDPMYVTRVGDLMPEYDLREVDSTLVVRVTEAEFGG